jgi:16S rRNA G527 N7-methylase RsmG
LANCDVVQSDVKNIDERYDFIVSRASLPPSDLMIHVKRLLRVPGVAMIALSRVASHYLEPVEQISGLRASVVQVPDGVLDTTVSLLRIETTT